MPRFLPLVVALILFSSTQFANAKDPMVFISAFAGGDQGAIHSFHFDLTSGALKPLHRNTTVQNPFFLALSPDKKFLYSIHALKFGSKNAEEIAAFKLLGNDGKLELLNKQSAKGSAACYLHVDNSGKTVVVANYSTGSVASLPVKEDGSLGEPASFVQHVGSSVNPARQKEPHAHCIVVSPDNKYAFAADLGLDQILCYKLDPKLGKITPNDPAFAKAPAGAGPRHLTFHPNGKKVYVINELLNSVTLFHYDSEKGSLKEEQTISTLPNDFKGTSYCADLKITPDGKYLYGTNRGHDSIACYSIGADGKLTLNSIEPSLGKGPQNLAITSNNGWLLCANMPGKNVVVFRIDLKTGKIKPTGEPVAMPSPSCIMLVE